MPGRTRRAGRRSPLILLSAFTLAALLAGCNGQGSSASSGGSTSGGASNSSASATSSSGGSSSTAGTATLSAAATTSTATASSTSTASASSESTTASTTTSASTGSSSSESLATVSGVPTPQLVASNVGAPGAASGSFDADAIINVAKKDTPGVVQITNEQVQLGAYGNSNQAVPAGVGTGIVIDSQGHILTNDHVVRGAQKLLVSTSNGKKELPAKLVGADPRTDLAVVQVSGASLPPLDLGNSKQLVVGQWVVAIGNALALPGGPTVTAGVVSALGRTVQEPPVNGKAGPFLFDVIQTSAPINPGNSGGPLVNLAGQVVGINTLEATQAEPGVPAQGIGFAIAIDTAKKIADTLIAQGQVNYGYLGVSITTNTPALAARFGLPNVPGVAVESVQQGSPAAQAGIAAGDVITSVNNQQITSAVDLFAALENLKPGDKVTVDWVQAKTNQKVSKQITLGQEPQQ